jgi:hypothetical protein
MLQIYWLSIGLFSGVMTLAWLFPSLFGAENPEFSRVTMTALLSFTGWGVMALYAPDVTTLQQGAEVSAAVSSEVQLFVTGLSLVSLLTLILYQVGVYPPEANEIPQAER